MADYSQGKIYKIECNITTDVYFGSTTDKYLSSRVSKHKNSRNCSAIKIIDRGNFTCKIIEHYPCKSRQELEARERWWIENNVCINKKIPTRTYNEWYEHNKEHRNQQCKEYYQNNKHKLQEKITCDCGGKYLYKHKSTHCKTKKHQKYIFSNSEY